jgi:hypothetical protein
LDGTPINHEVVMSLRANIEHLATAPGIEAVVVDTGDREFRGEDRLRPVLVAALELFAVAGESSVRLVVGEHTLVVQRERDEVVAVALPTGHAIAKSLRRMIRRMAKRPRGPLEAAARSDAAHGAGSALGGTDVRSPM